MEPDTLSESAIAAVVDSVFSAREFDRSFRESIWSRLGGLFRSFFQSLRGLSRTEPELYWLVMTILVLVLVAVVARAGYLLYARRLRGAALRGEGRTPRGIRSRDPLVVARDEAARGNFTEAAHALYMGLLETLARREAVRLHPSKTIGDYVRELRSRSSTLFARFRDFARSYEVVVYGIGTCDRERYERLHELALPILQPSAPQ